MTDVPPRAAEAGHDFDALFREHAGAVFRAVYAYSGGRRALAEEATAEAFARAIASERRIRRPIPWIYRTAFRAAAAELRKERREPIDPPTAEEPAGLGHVVDALRALTPNQRAAIVLRYEADLPVRDIAARMGTSAATVRVHLHRGRNRLRDLLGTEETDDA
jgi:RNA polymerase sigma-70 factor (ECF subfamily)